MSLIDEIKDKNLMPQMEYLYVHIGESLLNKNFKYVDSIILDFIEYNKFKVELYIGFLTITLHHIKELKNRNLLVNKAKELLLIEYKTEERVSECLYGLI